MDTTRIKWFQYNANANANVTDRTRPINTPLLSSWFQSKAVGAFRFFHSLSIVSRYMMSSLNSWREADVKTCCATSQRLTRTKTDLVKELDGVVPGGAGPLPGGDAPDVPVLL